jgi:hypothetical protein
MALRLHQTVGSVVLFNVKDRRANCGSIALKTVRPFQPRRPRPLLTAPAKCREHPQLPGARGANQRPR